MIAILIAIIIMIIASEPLSIFIQKNPSIKLLALSFLLLIGESVRTVHVRIIFIKERSEVSISWQISARNLPEANSTYMM